jgi:hypothetical protein
MIVIERAVLIFDDERNSIASVSHNVDPATALSGDFDAPERREIKTDRCTDGI